MTMMSPTVEPSIGMGATIYICSDRMAATVVDILRNGREILLQEDRATRTDNNGMSENQTYSYKEDPCGKLFTATLRKDGSFKITKTEEKVELGVRDRYYNFSF